MAFKPIIFQGSRTVRINLKRAITGIRGNIRDGLRLAGDLVKDKSEDLTSIDTSDLINSTFNTAVGSKKKPAQVIGYKKDYAAHVHEMPESTNWQRPGAENEFLEKAVIRNITGIINKIRQMGSRRPR